MHPEQTAFLIEMLRTSNMYSGDLSNGAKAQIWRNITDQCNAMPSARQRTVDQYKRHWYDLKMKVKNKLIRRQEAYSVPGTLKIPEHMELTDDEEYIAKFVKHMDGMQEIVDEALYSRKTPRTKDQTAILVKLVHINKVNFRKNNVAGRELIWKRIAETLNRMPGPEKTVEGWKKAYWSWRLQTGEDYEKELEKWIGRAEELPPSALSNTTQRDYDNIYEKYLSDDKLSKEAKLSDMQTQRLYELVSEQRAFLLTGTYDEPPLKKQIWANIANELNNLPGVHLSIEEWEKRGDWGKLVLERERRKQQLNNDIIPFGPDDVNNFEYEILNSPLEMERKQHIDDHLFSSQFDDNVTQFYDFEANEYGYDDDEFGSDHDFLYIKNEEEEEEVKLENPQIHQEHQLQQQQQHQPQQQHQFQQQEEQKQEHEIQHQPSSQSLEESTVDDDDNDDNTDIEDYEPKEKRLKVTPPIAKSFKFSNRIANTVEKLSANISDMQEVLSHTANSLANIEELMERQKEKQDETNTLLKRNNQLLKILVEYKIGKRKNNHN